MLHQCGCYTLMFSGLNSPLVVRVKDFEIINNYSKFVSLVSCISSRFTCPMCT